MAREERSLKQIVVEHTKTTGILPCIKLHEKEDFIAYAQAMYNGGARVVEMTMTTPGVLEAIESFSLPVIGKSRPKVTASIGVATVSVRSEDVENVLNHADEALYKAKHAGRNQVCCSDIAS